MKLQGNNLTLFNAAIFRYLIGPLVLGSAVLVSASEETSYRLPSGLQQGQADPSVVY